MKGSAAEGSAPAPALASWQRSENLPNNLPQFGRERARPPMPPSNFAAAPPRENRNAGPTGGDLGLGRGQGLPDTSQPALRPELRPFGAVGLSHTFDGVTGYQPDYPVSIPKICDCFRSRDFLANITHFKVRRFARFLPAWSQTNSPEHASEKGQSRWNHGDQDYQNTELLRFIRAGSERAMAGRLLHTRKDAGRPARLRSLFCPTCTGR